MSRCEVVTETSIVIMWTSKGGTERLCHPSNEEEKWNICSCLYCGTKMRVGGVLFPENN